MIGVDSDGFTVLTGLVAPNEICRSPDLVVGDESVVVSSLVCVVAVRDVPVAVWKSDSIVCVFRLELFMLLKLGWVLVLLEYAECTGVKLSLEAILPLGVNPEPKLASNLLSVCSSIFKRSSVSTRKRPFCSVFRGESMAEANRSELGELVRLLLWLSCGTLNMTFGCFVGEPTLCGFTFAMLLLLLTLLGVMFVVVVVGSLVTIWSSSSSFGSMSVILNTRLELLIVVEVEVGGESAKASVFRESSVSSDFTLATALNMAVPSCSLLTLLGLLSPILEFDVPELLSMPKISWVSSRSSSFSVSSFVLCIFILTGIWGVIVAFDVEFIIIVIVVVGDYLCFQKGIISQGSREK